MVSRVSILFTVAMSLTTTQGFAQDSDSNGIPSLTEATKYCNDTASDGAEPRYKQYGSERACVEYVRQPKRSSANQCAELEKDAREARTKFASACAGAGLPSSSSACSSAIARCQELFQKEDQFSIGKLFAENDLTSSGFGDACYMSTSKEQQEAYDKQQERVQETLREAQETISTAQEGLDQSNQNIVDAQERRMATEEEAKTAVAKIGVELPAAIRLENEKSFALLQTERRKIDEQRIKRAGAVQKIGEIQNQKATMLLGLMRKCEQELDKRKTDLIQAEAARNASTGKVARVRSFNEISAYESSIKKRLRRGYMKCMNDVNKDRAIIISQSNAQMKALEASIATIDNDIAMRKEAIEMEKNSLKQRIEEHKAFKELERQQAMQAVDNAQRYLLLVQEKEAQRQSGLQQLMKQAQTQITMANFGMGGLGGGMAQTVLGLFTGGGGRGPASGITGTISQAMAAKGTLDIAEAELSNANCSSTSSTRTPSSTSSGAVE